MDKSSFATLFETAVRRTLEQADLSSAENDLLVEFHGLSNPPEPIPTKAIDLLRISPDRFYFIVDVGVFLDGKSPALMFVRPTGPAGSVLQHLGPSRPWPVQGSRPDY